MGSITSIMITLKCMSSEPPSLPDHQTPKLNCLLGIYWHLSLTMSKTDLINSSLKSIICLESTSFIHSPNLSVWKSSQIQVLQYLNSIIFILTFIFSTISHPYLIPSYISLINLFNFSSC